MATDEKIIEAEAHDARPPSEVTETLAAVYASLGDLAEGRDPFFGRTSSQ